jgi:uncharacterized RDD family membrane protein YckC
LLPLVGVVELEFGGVSTTTRSTTLGDGEGEMEPSGAGLRQQGLQALRAGEVDRAIELLARAAEVDPADAEATALLGVAYSQGERHAEAARVLQAAVARQPTNPNYRFNLGVALERAGETPRATQAFRETLQLDPGHAAARSKLQALGQPLPPPGIPAPGVMPPPAASPPPRPTPVPPPAAAPRFTPTPPPAPPPFAAPPPGAYRDAPPAGGMFGGGPGAAPPPPGYAPSPYQQPPGYAGVPGYEYAPIPLSPGEAFGRRLGARILDGLLCWVMLVVTYYGGGAFVLLFGIGLALPFASAGGDAAAGGFVVTMFLAWGLLLLIGAFGLPGTYYGLILSRRGQTLGMMGLGLRMVGPDGGNPSFWRAFFRCTVGYWLSALLCAFGYLWMLWDPEQQTWHDKLFGTHVVKA